MVCREEYGSFVLIIACVPCRERTEDFTVYAFSAGCVVALVSVGLLDCCGAVSSTCHGSAWSMYAQDAEEMSFDPARPLETRTKESNIYAEYSGGKPL